MHDTAYTITKPFILRNYPSRRNLNEALYQSWLEVVELLSTFQFSVDDDEMMWQFTAKGTYSSVFVQILTLGVLIKWFMFRLY